MTALARLRATAYQQVLILYQRHWQRHVFIHINKTGGTSVAQALRDMPEGHKTALQKRAELGKAAWARKYSFAFVRNPWERLVSQYHYRLRINKTNLQSQPLGFSAWVQEVFEAHSPVYRDDSLMFVPQLDWITDEAGQVMVSYVGRYETLEQDFQHVCRQLQRPTPLPHLNASNHGPYQDYYDDASKALVGRVFGKDIAYFGYTF